MKSRSILPVATLLFSLTNFSGCQVLPPDQAPGDRDEQDGRASAVSAQGWSELNVVSGFESPSGGAEVKFDTSGHFETSRNACAQEEQGSLSLADWNQLVRATNELAASAERDEETCFPAGTTRWHFDGTTKIVSGGDGTDPAAPPRSEREVLQERGREVCTRMVNVDAARRLAEVLDRALYVAAIEGCTEAARR